MADVCYNYGMLGYLLVSWPHEKQHDSFESGSLYGWWIKVELSAYTLVYKGLFLKRVEIPRTNLADDISLTELIAIKANKEKPPKDMLRLTSLYLL